MERKKLAKILKKYGIFVLLLISGINFSRALLQWLENSNEELLTKDVIIKYTILFFIVYIVLIRFTEMKYEYPANPEEFQGKKGRNRLKIKKKNFRKEMDQKNTIANFSYTIMVEIILYIMERPYSPILFVIVVFFINFLPTIYFISYRKVVKKKWRILLYIGAVGLGFFSIITFFAICDFFI